MTLVHDIKMIEALFSLAYYFPFHPAYISLFETIVTLIAYFSLETPQK